MRVPKARKRDLVVESIGDETLVYDRRSDKVHCLNATCSRIWAACDGRRDIDELSACLGVDLPGTSARQLTRESLRKLSRAHLLETPFEKGGPSDPSRRRFAVRLARAAAVIPIIASIKAPLAKDQLRSCPNNCTGVADCTPCKKGNGNGPCNKFCCKGKCVNENKAERMGCDCD